MKSKAFHLFNNLSNQILFSEVIKSPYYVDLKKRLNIFSSIEKRSILIKQKIEYILLNFDINHYEIIIDYKIDNIRITKNKKIHIPFKNQDKNFFDIIFNLSEIIMKDCLGKKNNYGAKFSDIYFNILKKVYKIENKFILEFYKKLNVANNTVSIIYEGFKEQEAWKVIKEKHDFEINSSELYNQFINRTILKNNFIEIIICRFVHNKIKVFEISI